MHLQKVSNHVMELENIVGKGENATYQHFLLFPQYFLQDSFSGSLKEKGLKFGSSYQPSGHCVNVLTKFGLKCFFLRGSLVVLFVFLPVSSRNL